MIRIVIPKTQRLSYKELKKLIELYNSVKDKRTSIRINCVIACGKGWKWSTIEDILMVLDEDENKQIYFMDGSGFNHNVKWRYGWIKKGEEKLIKTNTKERENKRKWSIQSRNPGSYLH